MSGIKWTKAQENVLNSSGNVLVSASAGSGKTTVMLRKVLLLLKGGYNINRFLVMTFSNASAAEMRDKLVQKLYEEIRSGETQLKKQLELLNFSNICTIDSFCFSLYKSFFADIGLDPSYQLLDAQEAKLLFLESADQALDDFFEKGGQEFFEFARRFVRSRDFSPLKDAVKQISEFLDVQIDESEFIDKTMEMFQKPLNDLPAIQFYLQRHRRTLKRFSAEARNLLEEYDEQDKYKDILYDINNYIDNLYGKTTIKELASALRSPTDFGALRGKKPEHLKDLIDSIGALKTAVKGFVDDSRKELSVDFGEHFKQSMRDIEMLLSLTLAARSQYQKRKERKHSFDFADLSRVALKILADENRRKQVAEQYDFVFVDEYQDTNYIQEKLMTLVSSKDNLFMVGDPKQAIYQFRHAEPQIFLDRYYRYDSKQDGENRMLNDNFRSDSRVLDFVNMVFNELMTEDFGGIRYKNNAELAAGLTYPKTNEIPAVEIAVFEKDNEKDKSIGLYSVKNAVSKKKRQDMQAIYIADKINKLVGKEYIYDAGSKQKRLTAYSDIAILMYKRDGEAIIEELRSNGIPYSAPGFSDSVLHEIEMLVDLLRVVDNFADDIPLSAVMQSPMYRFCPQELLEIRNETPKTDFWESVLAFKGNTNIKNKIEKLLCDLERWKKTAARVNVSELMSLIVAEGYSQYLLSRGTEIIEQVNNFVNTASGKEYARNIPSFLAYFDNVYDGKSSISASRDAVRLMTVHNSKGLEFPIVFLANAQGGYSATHDINKDIYLDNLFGMAMKYFDGQTKTKKDTVLTVSFKKKAAYREREELLRLMYVAMTRAKNHLFITSVEKEIKSAFPDMQDSFIQWIYAAAGKNARIKDFFVSYCCEVAETEKEQVSVEQKSLTLDGLDFEYPHSEATAMPQKYTVTGLKESPQTEIDEKRVYLSEEERISRGVAYHTVMQHIDFNSDGTEEIKRQLEEMKEQGIISSEEFMSIDVAVLERTLSSATIALAKRGKVERERQFMLYLPAKEVLPESQTNDKILVQGVIDLIILGERNVIVDFKVTQSSASILKQRYKRQLDLYALAAEKLLGITIDSKIIYEITRNMAIEV